MITEKQSQAEDQIKQTAGKAPSPFKDNVVCASAAADANSACGESASADAHGAADEFKESYARSMQMIFAEYSQHEIYYKTLKLVAQESNETALSQLILNLPEMKIHLRSPRFYLDALYACGALDRTPLGQPSADACEDQSGCGNVELSSSRVAASESDADVDGATGNETGERDPLVDGVDENGMPIRFNWYLSVVGSALIDNLSPVTRLQSLLAEDPQAEPIYQSILAYCQKPRSRADVETHLTDAHKLDGFDVFTSFFLDRLEQNGGLVWDEGWVTTQEGEECLAQVR